ncbi:hypothetical protein AAVH_08481 [Aphelenchoides avenae]|nr:hypothetical protein AAVH_08481 [Aphelenchus avenae]
MNHRGDKTEKFLPEQISARVILPKVAKGINFDTRSGLMPIIARWWAALQAGMLQKHLSITKKVHVVDVAPLGLDIEVQNGNMAGPLLGL